MRLVENGFSLTAEEYSICMKAKEILEEIAREADAYNLDYDSAVAAGNISDLFSDFYQGEEE